MPQRVREVVVSVCWVCGHAWYARRGKPLRCARCKSPYWDRMPAGKKSRTIVRPPNPNIALHGQRCSFDQVCDILRIWQTNNSWVGVAFEHDAGLLQFGAQIDTFLHGALKFRTEDRIDLGLLRMSPEAAFVYMVGEKETFDQPYETLEIRFGQALIFLEAFRKRPKIFPPVL